MSIRMFEARNDKSVSEVFKETLKVFMENETPMVSFYLSKAKGSGLQKLKVSELPGLIDILNEARNNDFVIPVDNSLSSSDILSRTIKIDRDEIISFRCGYDGEKSSKIYAEDLLQAVDLLSQAIDPVSAAAEKLSAFPKGTIAGVARGCKIKRKSLFES